MRRGRSIVALLSATLILALFAAAAPSGAFADAAAKNNEGNRLYEKKRFDDALRKYTDAQAQKPDAPELHYNIGNVLFRKGEFAKAIEEYLRTQGGTDASLKQAAAYNRGNALMKQGQFQEAVEAYVQSLKAEPSDKESKRNLELALRMLQQQQQQQDQSQPQDKQPQDPKKQDQPTPQPQDEKKQDERKPPPSRRPGQMSEEEAEQILDALRETEKEGVKKHAQATAPRDARPEKDW